MRINTTELLQAAEVRTSKLGLLLKLSEMYKNHIRPQHDSLEVLAHFFNLQLSGASQKITSAKETHFEQQPKKTEQSFISA